MKQQAHKIYTFAGVALASITLLLSSFLTTPHNAHAQCVGGSLPGSLGGYILATNISGPIYISSEVWNQEHPTSPIDFYVNYDRNTNLWSGRGWHEELGWINFDHDVANHKAIVDSVKTNPSLWGNWDGVIDLSQVHYSNQVARFIGVGTGSSYTGGGNEKDIMVGLGDLDFSNVSFNPNNPCGEFINLFLNDTPTLYRTTCPIATPTIKWTSQNVENCYPAEGYWNQPTQRRLENNRHGEKALQGITDSGDSFQEKVFRLKCTGKSSKADVYGAAVMRCGPLPENVIPLNEFIKPTYREV